MPFVGKSPYGWGGFRIPMPRSSIDIYADRRRNVGGHDGVERRRNVYFKLFPAILINSIKRDLPVGRALAAFSFGLASVVFLCMVGFFIPRIMEEVAPLPVEITARLLEEPLPPPKPREVTPPPRITQKKVAEPLPVVPPPQKITAPPAPRERPKPLPEKVKIVAKAPVRPEPDIQVPAKKRDYRLERKTIVSLPKTNNSNREVKAGPSINKPLALNVPVAKPSVGLPEGNRAPLPGKKTFSSAAAGTTVDLPEAKGLSPTIGRPRSQGDSAAPVSGRSFSPPSTEKRVSLASTGPVGGYRRSSTNTEDTTISPPPGKTAAGGIGKANDELVDVPENSGFGMRTGAGSLGALQAGSLPSGKKSFIAEGAGELDPNLFVSLNQLGACRDQSEEDRLRTELATRLERDGQCQAGKMIFFFKYPETGYTMQVNIYNPLEFADKCAALTAALECILHSK
jgi:hypothetical protein